MSKKFNPNPTPFGERDYKKEVMQELEKGTVLNVFFLIFSYIESYLRDWLFISGSKTKKDFKGLMENIERISFTNILLFHLILGNFDIILYKKINGLSKLRNKLAHELVTLDLNADTNKKYIEKNIKFAINTCEEIVKLYKKSLEKEAKKIEFQKVSIKSGSMIQL